MSDSLWPKLPEDTGDVVCPFMTAAGVNAGKCIGPKCGMWKSAESTTHFDLGYEVHRVEDVGYTVYNKGMGTCSLFGGDMNSSVTAQFTSTADKLREIHKGNLGG